ncbi:MAG TPA: glycosyl hydrolase family 65 protein [Verrucomicrobiae bacterium]
MTHANLLSALFVLPLAFPLTAAPPPDDFPSFQVPGCEKEMATLRDLFWLHYPGAGPKATLWDEWLPDNALWPAVTTGNQSDFMRRQWRDVLSARIVDPEGYVATHQHASIAHQLGWPFPFWTQGRRGCGWHFSFKNTIGPGWRPNDLSKTTGWVLTGAGDSGLGDDGWTLDVTNAQCFLTAPPWRCDTLEVPFLQIRSKSSGLGELQPFIEWTTPAQTNFDAARRMYFEPPKPDQMVYTMVPMFHHPQWTGEVAQLRLCLGNNSPGKLVLQAFFSQYDTRHNINGQNFIRGCAKYFWWTRDLNFLRSNIPRMRSALRYLMTEHDALDRKVVYTTWVGHDGRSGLKRVEGKKEILTGVGIGNNYWDLLPFGNLDCYATVQYYDAILTLTAIEREIRAHPDWSIPGGILSLDPAWLEKHAADVKAEGNRLFWNQETGRFVACVDSENQTHDYGFSFLNCEAIYYDFASPEHARSIMSWLNGDRKVDGDTSQGDDIYHWRFGPRATTKRNLDWYFWAWSNPESIPWGNQVQDGGAVLGFAYHDLMARLDILGPDNAWQRLQHTLRWFDEVEAAGGYRKYYDGKRDGSLQGGGTPGGLGLDHEFFESVLVPQVMLNGFLRFHPDADGFRIDPRLPQAWPELGVNRLRFQDSVLRIKATRNTIELWREGNLDQPFRISLPPGEWSGRLVGSERAAPSDLKLGKTSSGVTLNWVGAPGIRLER